MPHPSKRKGTRLERDLVHRHSAAGIDCEPVPLSGAVGGSYSGDLRIGRYRGEVKARAKWYRVTRHNPCPICQKDHGCEVTGDWIRCRRVDSGPTFVRPIRNMPGGLHNLNGHRRRNYTPPPATPQARIAPPDTRTRIYHALLDQLPLDRRHKRQLTGPQRQLTPDQIKRQNYRTLPAQKERGTIARQLLDRGFALEDLLAVPGFYWSKRGRGDGYLTIAGAAGLLCPMLDEKGRILGLQVRPDKPVKGAKYLWLSSDKYGGPGPGGDEGLPVHFARPAGITDERIYITEGPIKANITADRLAAVVVAVAGVDAFDEADLAERVAELSTGVDKVVVAFDADKAHNARVQKRSEDLAGALVDRGLAVEVADWDVAVGKGIDDLLLAGGTPTFTPWTDPGTSPLRTIPGELVPSLAGDRAPLPQAWDQHRKALEDALDAPGGTQFVIKSGPGTGKTKGFFDAVEHRLHTGPWPKDVDAKGRQQDRRIVYVTDTKEQIDGLLTQFPWLARGNELGQVVIRTGRDGGNCNPDYMDDITAYGNRRHSIVGHFCIGCPLARDKDFGCGYQQDKRAAKSARLVIATKAAIFNSAEALDPFDLVVVDEDMVRALVEDVVLTRPLIKEWIDGMDRAGYPVDYPARQLVDLFKLILAQVGPDLADEDGQRPLWPLLRQYSDQADNLVAQAAQTPADGDQGHTMPFEEGSGPPPPLRFFRDLVADLQREQDRPAGDTRLFLARIKDEAGHYSGVGIVDHRLRTTTLEALADKVVVNLDATPSPLLTRLFPQAQVIDVQVPEHMHVTQITDALGTARSLEDPAYRARLERIIQAQIQGKDKVVIFCPKKYNPDEDGAFQIDHPGVIWGHYGRHNRAHNNADMMGAELVILIAAPYHPPAALEAQVQAIRDGTDPPAPSDQPNRYKPYLWRDEDGQGCARRLKAHPDPDVDQAIDAQVEAELRQALHRTRPALRQNKPVDVLLLTAYPIDGLAVDELTTLKALDPTPPVFNLAERNQQRTQAKDARINQALAELAAEGLDWPTQRQLTARARISQRDAQKVLKTRRAEFKQGVIPTVPLNNTSCTLPDGINTRLKTESPPTTTAPSTYADSAVDISEPAGEFPDAVQTVESDDIDAHTRAEPVPRHEISRLDSTLPPDEDAPATHKQRYRMLAGYWQSICQARDEDAFLRSLEAVEKGLEDGELTRVEHDDLWIRAARWVERLVNDWSVPARTPTPGYSCRHCQADDWLPGDQAGQYHCNRCGADEHGHGGVDLDLLTRVELEAGGPPLW